MTDTETINKGRSIEVVRTLYDAAKDTYDHVHDVSGRLDTKTNVIFGFLSLVIGLIVKWSYELYSAGKIPLTHIGILTSTILAVSILSFVISIYKSIEAYVPRTYQAPDAVDAINLYANLDEIKVIESLARDYANTASFNDWVNKTKSKMITSSFRFFFLGLLMFIVFIAFVVMINGGVV